MQTRPADLCVSRQVLCDIAGVPVFSQYMLHRLSLWRRKALSYQCRAEKLPGIFRKMVFRKESVTERSCSWLTP